MFIKTTFTKQVARLLCLLFFSIANVANVAIASNIEEGRQLAKKAQCLGCHATNHKVIGPAFVEVAKRYANNPQALSYLSNKVRLGGSGTWGVVAMPANKNNLTDAELQKIILWVLSLRNPS